MKILVPTDFSMHADHAIQMAIEVAKTTSSEIHLYHSAKLPEEWEDLPASKKYADELNKDRALWVRDKLQVIEKRITADGIPCFIHYTGGDFLSNIEEILTKEDFDLIIMGSHGASGKYEWFIGSKTQKVLRKVNQNVLVVKAKTNKLDFRKSVFVTDLGLSSKDDFQKYLQFITLFPFEEIHILCINTNSFYSQPGVLIQSSLEDLKDLASELPIETHFHKDLTVDAGVREFVKANEIDLVAISNSKKSALRRFFRGSHVEMIVNHSMVPVLSIDY